MTNPSTTKAAPKLNRLGRSKADYKGRPSTLCKGCGHDSITSQLIQAFWEADIDPWQVAKMSGIGCSSKTTAYFLDESHGFNSVHGRMAPISTGAYLANHNLVYIGVSGDGDSASIGLGNFLHMVRRHVPMIYIIENNGVYGLTKGQFSATADKGSLSKGGVINQSEPIDCCALAIQMGCEYVARTFSGDFKQLGPLIKGALSHTGTALIDIVSPCITFNNHEGSTKSLAYAKSHEEQLHEIGFVPQHEPITADYDAGEIIKIDLPDGSSILLKKLDRNHNPANKLKALNLLMEASESQLFLTGLIYCRSDTNPIEDQLNLVDESLATLPESMLRPPPEKLREVMDSLS